MNLSLFGGLVNERNLLTTKPRNHIQLSVEKILNRID